ncbi:GNAT family N-acetyltransferase [Priestia taiwanensis]|uniref:N-acetyltransferase n=1 Tax=Priestia taiwanensis TaxID=1347902 RepID=A0A917ASB3_9BACI|nr:GNAT family N-acetyltransferase [Priestia taiwanensis]MBM7364084.1 putative GNAT family N-acyltransferase [Priestia taiwanensis]GGE71477.1 N-acetyltransferase [Priestia taiwanensis]
MNIELVTTKEQLQDAYDVRTAVFVHEQHVPIEEEIDEHDATATHIVVYDNDNAIGAARLRLVDGYGKLERICIMKDYRSAGYGKHIVMKLEELAREQNMTKSKLNAQTQAEGFYKKLGYETVSDVFMDANIPHVTMTKQL